MSLVWTKTSAPSTNTYWTWVASSSSGQKIAATVSGGGIWRSTDYGVTWTLTTSGAQNGLGWTRIASNASGDKLVAAVYGGKIWTYDATIGTWTEQTVTGIDNAYWDGLASDSTGQYLVAIEHEVGMYNSNNWGVTWYFNQPPGSNWYIVWSCVTSDSTGNILTAGSITSSIGGNSEIWTTTNGQAGAGVTWVRQTDPSVALVSFWCMTCDSTGTKLAAATGTSTVYPGYIWTSINQGATWAQCITSGTQLWTSITSNSAGDKLAATTSSGIYISNNGGGTPGTATWTRSNGLNINWTSVSSDSTGLNLVAVTTGNGIYSTHSALQPAQYIVGNADLSTIFSPGPPYSTTTTHYGEAGTDLNASYEVYNGANPAPATNFLVNGADLNTIFEGI